MTLREETRREDDDAQGRERNRKCTHVDAQKETKPISITL
jgi:hypothetical protein